ncbi:putative folate transporter 1, chloroplastic-like [Capsicum annuum]|nr:putative folate transporter 1, chloroplastic-like [Capsicum annuum]
MGGDGVGDDVEEGDDICFGVDYDNGGDGERRKISDSCVEEGNHGGFERGVNGSNSDSGGRGGGAAAATKRVEESARRVQVRFVTKLKPPFKAPPTSIAIPSNLTRFGLSSIVNNLLKAGKDDWNPEPFDFLIDGELVRMSLEEFLLAKGISAEKILEIEYIRAVAPRKQEEPSLHDDWVSAVDGSNSKFVLTGCYDGLGRIWKAAGSCTHLLEGHSGAITSVCVVNPRVAQNGADQIVATASKDRTLRLWKFDADDSSDQIKRIRAFKILNGHSASVQSVAANNAGDMLCSGSWDCQIALWQANGSDTADVVSVKKRKKDAEEEDPQVEEEAKSTLVGHTQCVSSVVWPQDETIYSASWDHSIKRWDVEMGKDSLNLYCGKVINCLDIGGEGSTLIAAGGSDPILRIWDPRRPGTSAPVYQFSSHSSWISTCKWHEKSWFHLVSASYDGKVMLWDLRTAWPLAVIDTHKDKVLCADWWKSESVISGGADSNLCISSDVCVLRSWVQALEIASGRNARIDLPFPAAEATVLQKIDAILLIELVGPN